MSFDNFRVQRYLYCKTVSVFTTGGGGGELIGQKIHKLLIDIACSVNISFILCCVFMVLASSQSRKNGKQKSWQIPSHLVLCQQRLLFRENVASARRVIHLANACWIVRFSPQINSTCCTRAFIVASFFTALSRQRVDGFPVLKFLFRISHYLSLTVGL